MITVYTVKVKGENIKAFNSFTDARLYAIEKLHAKVKENENLYKIVEEQERSKYTGVFEHRLIAKIWYKDNCALKYRGKQYSVTIKGYTPHCVEAEDKTLWNK